MFSTSKYKFHIAHRGQSHYAVGQKLFPNRSWLLTIIELVLFMWPITLPTLLHYMVYQTGTFCAIRHPPPPIPTESFAVILKSDTSEYFTVTRSQILRFFSNYNTQYSMNTEHWWKGTDRGERKYLSKSLHQCHWSIINVKWRSELENKTPRSTFCDWPYCHSTAEHLEPMWRV
jgi:hypothetical protein